MLDISDPTDVRQLAWWNPWDCAGDPLKGFDSSGHANELVLRREDRRLFVSAGDTQLVMLDTSDPADPKVVAKLGGRDDDRVAWGLDVTSSHFYLAHIVSPGGPFTSNWAGIAALSYR